MTENPLQLRQLLERLIDAEIRFVLVGGLAVNAWGYLRGTRDVDLVPDPDPENLAELNSLLRGLGGKVDPQVHPYGKLEEQATDVDLDGLVVRVCSLEHLLEMKRASNRPRDRDDLEALEAAQEDTDLA